MIDFIAFSELLNDLGINRISRKSNGCIECYHRLNRYGYPRDSKGRRLSRLVLEMKLGRMIKDGLFALHHCDNSSCINPDCLYEGDQIENMRGMRERGRSCTGDKNGSRTKPERLVRGTKNHQAKLTEDDVRRIRSLYASGVRPRFIEAEFSDRVTRMVIWHIIWRKTWGHVD